MNKIFTYTQVLNVAFGVTQSYAVSAVRADYKASVECSTSRTEATTKPQKL